MAESLGTYVIGTILGGITVVSDVPTKLKETTTMTGINSRRMFNDFNNDPWDKLPEEEKHPAIKLFADEITAEKDRLFNNQTDKEYIDIVQKKYTRAMKAMGQINARANQAEIVLGTMITSAHKTGDPLDRSNGKIGVALEEFEQKIHSIMKAQEFSLEYRYFANERRDANLACFSPTMIADRLLEVTRDHVQKKLSKEGVDASDLSINDVKPQELPRICYKYDPFEFSPWIKTLNIR